MLKCSSIYQRDGRLCRQYWRDETRVTKIVTISVDPDCDNPGEWAAIERHLERTWDEQ